jgi:phage terminase small subunit
MTAGRKRVPAEVKLRNGNPGKRRIALPKTIAGRVLEGEKVPPPTGLSKAARQAWRELTSYMIAGGIWDRADRFITELAATIIGDRRELEAYLDTIPIAKREPALTRLLVAMRTSERLVCGDLGITPDKRTMRAELPRGTGESDGRGNIGRMRAAVGARERPALAVVGDDAE